MTASTPPPAEPPQKLRWFQYSLRSLFLLTLVVAIGMSWYTVTVQDGRNQKAAAKVIRWAGSPRRVTKSGDESPHSKTKPRAAPASPWAFLCDAFSVHDTPTRRGPYFHPYCHLLVDHPGRPAASARCWAEQGEAVKNCRGLQVAGAAPLSPAPCSASAADLPASVSPAGPVLAPASAAELSASAFPAGPVPARDSAAELRAFAFPEESVPVRATAAEFPASTSAGHHFQGCPAAAPSRRAAPSAPR